MRDHSDRVDAVGGLHLSLQLAKKVDGGFGRSIFRARGGEPNSGDLGGIKAGIDVEQSDKGPQQQASADQQHEAESNLAGDQNILWARVARNDSATKFSERFRNVGRGCAKRRSQTK